MGVSIYNKLDQLHEFQLLSTFHIPPRASPNHCHIQLTVKRGDDLGLLLVTLGRMRVFPHQILVQLC